MNSDISLSLSVKTAWSDLIAHIESDKCVDLTIYQLGQQIFIDSAKEKLPENAQILTEDRIVEKAYPLSSENFDPLLASQKRRSLHFKLHSKISWKGEFDKLEQELQKTSSSLTKENVEEFCKAYEVYSFSPSHFDPFAEKFSQAAEKKRHADLAKEKILNLSFNYHRSHQEVENFINKHKEKIVEEFYLKSKLASLDKFTFTIAYINGETHNFGRKVAQVVFSLSGQKAFTVMYKPREAGLDRALQDLFQKIELPHYKILSFPEDNKSVWQYISGKKMILGKEDPQPKSRLGAICPEAFLQNILMDSKKRLSLLGDLQRLNRILLSLNISDLHGENVIMGDDEKIYPIDLEVMDDRQPTMLMIDDYGSSNIVSLRASAEQQLTKPEKKAIEEWKIRNNPSKRFSLRCVLVSTQNLFLIRYQSNIFTASQNMANLIHSGLSSRGYNCSAAQKRMINNQALIDILNGDVPFFTELNGTIYYGYQNSELEIATKK
ncbi:MAG: DUF4135 domain-containing protein [Verrucomicrobia bacterium]|nr:DUF4135 domain-containing protein [Verrucomicrobiota bacterium]